MIKKKKLNSSGQTLIEALIATLAVVMLVTGLISGTTASLRAVQNARRRSLATKLTQEGLEIIRNRRDQGWNNFQALNPSGTRIYCLDDSVNPFSSYYIPPASDICLDNITITEGSQNFVYTRTAKFTLTAANSMEIFVQVRWQESDIYRYSNAQTTLTNWR